MDIAIARKYLGKIVYAWFYYKNHHFAAKMIKIRGDILIFEVSDGRKFVNRSSEIANMYEIEQEA